jgi:hypothetical protein
MPPLLTTSQRYVNECCESESDGKIDGFGAGCCKRRGVVAVAVWCYDIDPLPNSNAVQDTTLPDAPTTTALAEKDGWKTVEGKAAQKKRRNEKADNKWATERSNKPPTTKTGGRGKNSHQPRMTDTSTKKTWAEVVKSGGSNVQIVLGNGNLGLATPPTKKRGERTGGAARRLGRKDGVGERGEERRGKVGRQGAGGKEAGTTRGWGERVEESGGGGGPAAV